MKFSIFSLLSLMLLFAIQISGQTTTIDPQLPEVVLSRRADEHVTHSNTTGSMSPTTTSTATAKTTTTTTTTTKGNPTIWASPAILQDGTLFYIAISISTLLWCTGKVVDLSLDQQERQAEFLSRR